MNEFEILNVKEAAELLRADKRTVERKAKAGYYPPNVCGKHGRYWLFNKQELLKFVFQSV